MPTKKEIMETYPQLQATVEAKSARTPTTITVRAKKRQDLVISDLRTLAKLLAEEYDGPTVSVEVLDSPAPCRLANGVSKVVLDPDQVEFYEARLAVRPVQR